MFDTASTISTISAREASHNFAQYLNEASKGKSFTVLKHGKPMAKIVPVTGDQAIATRSPKEQAAFEKKIAKALSFRFSKPYAGKFNRMDAYDDL